MHGIRLLLLGFCLLLFTGARATGNEAVLPLTATSADHPAGLYLDYFSDPGRQCGFACARERFAGGQFRHSDVETPNFGITGSYWFRLQVQNLTREDAWVAEADLPYLDDVQLFVLREDGGVDHWRSGDAMPTAQRPIHDRNIVLPLPLAPGERATLFLRVTNEGPVTLPLNIETRQQLDSEASQENLVYGLYFGILICVALYNLMLFLILRDVSHLFYVVYVAAFAMTMATVFGFSALYFWPENTWWINRAVPVSVLVTGIGVMLFTRKFLALPRGSLQDRVTLAQVLWIVALFPVAMFAPFGIAVQVIYITAVLAMLWLFGTGVHQVLSGNESARYFMLAWVVLMLAVTTFLLTKLAVLPSNTLTEHGILFGSALEAILLSLALAHRFVIIREESARIQSQATNELEQRVEERTRELDQALQARSEFIATVSHEIRTPMNGVLGITELLLDSGLSERQLEYARIIQGSGRTLLTIINDLLDYSKIEAGKMTLEKVPFRIRDLLKGAIEIFTAEAARKKLAFRTRIDDDVPVEVVGDPVRLQQVLNNLISNAIKFTDDGEITLAVHRESDGRLTFTVSDSGIGIDPSIQPQLFEAFNQGDRSTARRFGGTGLGLAISRRLIGLMGGSISFESDPGKGTTFYFTIPARAIVTGRHGMVEVGSQLGGLELKILVVDDNLINLQVAAGLLRKLGHHVETVDNGPEALERVFAPDIHYDLVLMDCEMPGMDGFAATREIRRRELDEGREHLQVVALTAHAFSEKIEACIIAGMDDHLAKPLSLRSLEQTLVRVVQRGEPGR